MAKQRGTSFDRKVEQLLVERLRAGQSPEALHEELRSRYDDAEAEAMLSRAEAWIVPPRPHGEDALSAPTTRIVTGVAYTWTVVLVLQNIGILMEAGLAIRMQDPLAPGIGLFPRVMGFALLKIGLLCAGVFAFKRWRNAYSTAGYVLALLFAFPFGVLIERLFGQSLGAPNPAIILSVSALFTYAAAFLVAFVYWRTRQETPQRVAIEAFD